MATNRFRKANPSYSDVHVSTPLTNVSIAHWQANADKYRASTIFPVVGVMKQADFYYTYTAADLRRSQAKKRAPGTASEGGNYRVSKDQYVCERFSLHKTVSDPERDNADPQFDLDTEATEFVTDQVALAEEEEWTSGFFTTSTWTGGTNNTDQTGTSGVPGANQFLQFDDVASEPIQVFRREMVSIEAATGYKPNQLVLGARVWQALADHPDLLDRIKHTQTGAMTTDLLGQILEIPPGGVIVLSAVVNSSGEGQTASTDFIAGKHALVCYTAPSVGLKTPTAGLSFVWTASGTPIQGARIKRFRVEKEESDYIEGERWVDFKQTSADLGAFLSSAVA